MKREMQLTVTVANPRYWALRIPFGLGTPSLVSAGQISQPTVWVRGMEDEGPIWSPATGADLIVPLGSEPNLVLRTTEVRALRQALGALDVEARDNLRDHGFEIRVRGDEADVALAEQILERVAAPDLLEDYAVQYDRNSVIAAGDAEYQIVRQFDRWYILFEGATVTSASVNAEGELNYSGFGLAYRGQQFQGVALETQPEPVQRALARWLESTRVVMVNGEPAAVLRPGIVDLLHGGGEMHMESAEEDEETAALRFFGLFSLFRRPEDLITQGEAARLVGVSPQAVSNALRDGRLNAYEQEDAVGHRPGDRLVSRRDVERLWSENLDNKHSHKYEHTGQQQGQQPLTKAFHSPSHNGVPVVGSGRLVISPSQGIRPQQNDSDTSSPGAHSLQDQDQPQEILCRDRP